MNATEALTAINQKRDEIARLTRELDAMRNEEMRQERRRKEALIAEAGLTVEKRHGTRFYNLNDVDGSLLAVVVYKCGALAAGAALAAARLNAVRSIQLAS